MPMNRRELLQYMMGASVAPMLMPSPRVYAAPEDYTGRFLVTLQLEGAWDVSSFCDPKVNQTGEREINRWSRTGEIQTAGNLQYAPIANNAAFFNKYYQDTLVINGIDAQTNSHSTGVLHNWSGRNSVGYPSLTALFAAANGPGLPLSYLNYGGYAETARLIRYTRLDDVNALLNILQPNVLPWNEEERYRSDARLQRILDAQQARLSRLRSSAGTLPRQQYAMEAYYDARGNTQGLQDFANEIPPSDQRQSTVDVTEQMSSSLMMQMQITTLAFKSGAACSADMYMDGFDTHADHDDLHQPLLGHLSDALDYLWTYAESEGIADRLTVVVGSDFSRTPYYNDSNGKDHWPIGSMMVMEKDAPWGNRVIGVTDEAQNALPINPATLTPGNSGTLIYPRHVHKALRTYLGLTTSGIDSDFTFSNTEDLDLFG